MPDEEKTTVEETKTVEEKKAEVEETEAEEKTVEETKTEPVKEETKVKDGDEESIKASGEPPVTYEEVMDFIERHDLPKGLALGESMTIVMDMYLNGSKNNTMRLIVFGMGQTTDADFGVDDPAEWDGEFTRALYVGDVATGVVYAQSFGEYPNKEVMIVSYWLGTFMGFDKNFITYFGLMAGLCAMEKFISGGGKKSGSTEVESTFTVSDVGCSMPLRDKQSFHLNMLVDAYGDSSDSGSGGLS